MKNSQNAFLEVGLDLGAVGISVILAIIVTALWRSIRCCLIGIMQLGWFSSVFFVSAILAGQTEPTLGSNQNMFWLIFTIMFFSCGTVLAVGQQNKRRQRKLTLGLGLLKQQG